MLKLNNITKSYVTGDTTVEALKGVNIEFRPCEFVSILGPSGCGKTTLLNIIGGLDQYTNGDLSINGVSTKSYKSRDWDNYRNHSVGFVFQSYNLIPHQTVLSNVELALTLSGVSKDERRKRAKAALEKVGLGDQLKKKPAQMSGGQMQRVAIARAIVNDPEILLADEPTGALDTETSVQVMDILKEISKDRLVIMVTHNPELAEKYSTRIIRLLDGLVISDSNPYIAQECAPNLSVDDIPADKEKSAEFKGESPAKPKKAPKPIRKKNSMSHKTAISLSFNNLLTKKGRTFMTSFAGSIGIIGIALILALSNGIQGFIDKVQRETLSTYPLTIESATVDYSGLIAGMQASSASNEIQDKDPNAVYSSDMMGKFLQTLLSEIRKNDLANFKNFIDSNTNGVKDVISAVDYDYNVALNVYSIKNDKAVQVNPSPIMDIFFEKMSDGQTQNPMGSQSSMGGMMGGGSMADMYNLDVWEQMIPGKEDGELINKLLFDQYELVGEKSAWPKEYNEVVLVVDEDNRISDFALYTLNIKDQSVVGDRLDALKNQENITTDDITKYTIDDLMAQTFYLAPNDIYFEYDSVRKIWIDHTKDKDITPYFQRLLSDNNPDNDPIEIKVSGIIRPKSDAVATSISGAVAYTRALTDFFIDRVNNAAPTLAQLANPNVDIFTGIEFPQKDENEKPLTLDDIKAIISSSMPEEIAADTIKKIDALITLGYSEEQVLEMFKSQVVTESTYEANIQKLGYVDLNAPQSINIYTSTFEDKDKLTGIIDDYNEQMKTTGREDMAIQYTDLVGILMSSISTIINIISYVLIGFVSISLVVSSIMIGIITYISVLERTKEIGILRAMGASKKDISRVFNAETGIIGLCSGLVGIGVTWLLTLPINVIVDALTKNSSTRVSHIAALPAKGAIILVIISVVLTLIGGLIPSKLAAKKDPVEALRSE